MADTKVLVYCEARKGRYKKGSLEALSEGRRIADRAGGSVVAVTVGKGCSDLANELKPYGPDRIIAANVDWLGHYNGEAYGRIVSAIAKAEQPSVILVTATLDGKDLAPRVAGHLGVTVIPDCTAVESGDDGRLTLTRPVYAGKAYATVTITDTPQVVSIRPNAVAAAAPDASQDAPVEPFSPDFGPDDLGYKVTEVQEAKVEKVDLTEAERVVSGGRGLKAPENFKILEELADTLGATVGASRAVVDEGWRPHADQIGQTGKTISPNLYMGFGISGAIQHLAGMSTSKCIVAVNKDPEAPIFKVADYGIVGDLFEVVPALNEELKKLEDS